MRYTNCLAIILVFSNILYAQKPSRVYLNPTIIEGTLEKITVPLKDFIEPPFDGNVVKGEKIGYHPKGDWILNDSINPDARPNGWDPAWQKDYNFQLGNTKALNQNYNGMGYSSVNPPDPSLDVSANHVIQMINGSGGSYFKIWDKAGTVVQGQTYFDSFTGIGGLGDPIVLYDQLADRWMMSEFSATGNKLVVAISQTSDPLGSWYIYSYTAPEFPDYPKYGIWPNAYVVTTNESDPAVYALDRTQMLAGTAGAAQRFTVPPYGTIGFQALTPVDLDGNSLPGSGEPAMVMRMADDAWDPNLNNDQLELFEFDIDFTTPSNTSLTLTQTITTAPFDTHLCGYTSFSCIAQQGSGVKLDPLRELLMNRIQYRKFTNHESMVMCHVTDVNGNDRAGIRWYELRRTTGNWFIHQEGTYSPDTESRWMSSIAINADGAIGLAYNVSSSSSYPSIKYTGRRECDPLNSMTQAETTIIAGSAANSSNRYGDYASMSVDPSDGSFWFTGEYNPASQWSTRIANFDFSNCAPTVSFTNSVIDMNEMDADIDNNCLDYKEIQITIALSEAASVDPTIDLVISGGASNMIDFEAPAIQSATLSSGNLEADFVFKIFDDAYVESPENIIIDYTLNSNGGNAVSGSSNQTVTINIESNDQLPEDVVVMTTLMSEDFEGNNLGVFTTDNPSGDTPYQTDNASNASSSNFTIPSPPNGTYLAYVNDDDCNCNQNQVNLVSPVLDLSNASAAQLSFNYFFEGNTYQNKTEDADLLISVNGGTSYSLLEDLADGTVWQNRIIDLSSYLGEANVRINFRYSDGTGWLYGFAVDDIVVEIGSVNPIQTLVNSTQPAEAYLGPNATVHFFDPVSNNIMLSIENLSSHDFGCTTVEVDRPGTVPSALVFATNNTNEYVATKTFKISPANNSVTANYNLELYFEEEEIAAWENITTNVRANMEIVKVAGNNRISDVTPANASNFDISYAPKTLGAYGSDVVLNTAFSDGFSGFGLGIPTGGEGCASIITNTWVGPTTGGWFDSANNWSLSAFPDHCHDVVIPQGFNIQILSGELAKGFTLEVEAGAEIWIESTGQLDIVAPD